MMPGPRQFAWLGGLALALPAGAQTAPGYVDKVLEEGPQVVLKSEQELGGSRGWPRLWRADYSLTRSSGVHSALSQGLALSGHVDTPNHGALSLSLAANRSRFGDRGGADGSANAYYWRLDQLALPLDGGWSADHSAGHLAAPQVTMSRGLGRIGLPATPMEGAAGVYKHGLSDQFALALGRPGIYTGVGVNAFSAGEGRLLFGGAQVAVAPSSAVAFQLADAADIRDTFGGSGSRYSSRGAWTAWRWQGKAPWAGTIDSGVLPLYQRLGGLEFQLNALHSRTEAEGPGIGAGNAAGAWLDARWRSRWLDQAGGVFYLQPNLRWAGFRTVADMRGGYWRGDFSTRQWHLGGALEWSDSTRGAHAAGTFGSLSGRYRLDTRNTLLGALAVRRGNGEGESLRVGWDRVSEWGETQWHLDLLRAPARRAVRAGADHSFQFGTDTVLATSLAIEREDDFGRRRNAVIWAVVGSIRPWTGVVLDANLRGSHGNTSRVVSGSVGASWIIDPNWSVLGQVSHTRGQDLRPLTVLSPITQAAELVTAAPTSASHVQLTLRYQDRAGRSVAPLGAAVGAGAGGISGHVYFDENGNGRREASEAGVPDIVIRLDGRFATRTDAQGRYDFPLVGVGPHRIQIVPDNVPLPWNPAREGAQTIEVRVRSTVTQDFPLRREP